MLWAWWGGMVVIGLLIGLGAAYSQSAWRVFLKTLAGPLVVAATRLFWPDPIRNSMPYVFLDIILIALAAFAGDYLLGWKLGRSDRSGFRQDAVGH